MERAFRACPVRLTAPAVAGPGEPVRIDWTGFTADDDHVSIVRARGSDAETFALAPTAHRPLTLTAPRAPGTYEVRYELGKSRRILARSRLIVRPSAQPAVAISSAAATQSTGSPTRISPSSRTTP